MNKIIVTFDTETNGFKPTDSVLSISAMKIKVNTETKEMEKIDEFNRFYFCLEEENPKAIAVNGLTAYKIRQEREKQNATYPSFYKDDRDSFKEFCEGIDLIVAHNYDYDSQYIDFKKKSFCTMKEGSELYKNAHPTEKGWLKLKGLSEFFKVSFEEDNLHGSQYDTLILSRILFKMLKYGDKKLIEKLK